jgi:transposase
VQCRASTERAVVYEFCNSRQGQHAATLLEGFQGSLVCDDYSGYKALFKQQPIQEAGCWAECGHKASLRTVCASRRVDPLGQRGLHGHARRKFFEAHKLNQSEIAKEALHRIQQL